MQTVREHTNISAPVEDVFTYMDEPAHQTEITPSLIRSELVERLPNGGARVRYTHRILGGSFSGEVQATDYVPYERIVWTMTGDLQGTLRWYFSPADRHDQTRFTYAATYVVPGPSLLRSMLAPFVRRYNEREVQTLLRRLKKNVEM